MDWLAKDTTQQLYPSLKDRRLNFLLFDSETLAPTRWDNTNQNRGFKEKKEHFDTKFRIWQLVPSTSVQYEIFDNSRSEEK